MPRILGYHVDTDWRRWLETGEVSAFRIAARVVFLVILVAFIILSTTISLVFLAVVFGLLAGLMLRIMLPDQKFRAWARGYWTGEAGDRWRRRTERWGDTLRGWLSLVARTASRLNPLSNP